MSALAMMDALIDAHLVDCQLGTPDACERCDELWSARADVHHLIDALS